jgi:hypothetical protein
MVSERDAAMRLAALNMLEQLHNAAGATTTWALLGPLKDQQRSLVEERLKHKDCHEPPAVAHSHAAAPAVALPPTWCGLPCSLRAFQRGGACHATAYRMVLSSKGCYQLYMHHLKAGCCFRGGGLFLQGRLCNACGPDQSHLWRSGGACSDQNSSVSCQVRSKAHPKHNKPFNKSMPHSKQRA